MLSESNFHALVDQVAATTVTVLVRDGGHSIERKVKLGPRTATKIVGEIVPLVERISLAEQAGLLEEIRDAMEFDTVEGIRKHLRRLL